MSFAPIRTLLGAAMMGTAATKLLLLNGSVLGVSGFNPDPEQLALVSLAGLMTGGFLLGRVCHALEEGLNVRLLDVYAAPLGWSHVAGLVAAGALVGLGSKLSSGCTSGHMLCGVSRLSPRSLVASAMFVSVGTFTRLLFGSLAPFNLELESDPVSGMPSWMVVVLLQLPIMVYQGFASSLNACLGDSNSRRLVAFGTSLHFALGLMLSGMLRPSKILSFMSFAADGNVWDPSLILIAVGGVFPQLFAWRYWLGEHTRRPGTRPTFAEVWSIPETSTNSPHGITAKLVIGAVIFGIGWGLCGICPGPAVVLLGAALGGKAKVEILHRVGPWACGFAMGGIVGSLF